MKASVTADAKRAIAEGPRRWAEKLQQRVCVCVCTAGDKSHTCSTSNLPLSIEELQLLPRASELADSLDSRPVSETHLSGSQVCLSIHALPVAKKHHWSVTTSSGKQKSCTFNHNQTASRKPRCRGSFVSERLFTLKLKCALRMVMMYIHTNCSNGAQRPMKTIF